MYRKINVYVYMLQTYMSTCIYTHIHAYTQAIKCIPFAHSYVAAKNIPKRDEHDMDKIHQHQWEPFSCHVYPNSINISINPATVSIPLVSPWFLTGTAERVLSGAGAQGLQVPLHQHVDLKGRGPVTGRRHLEDDATHAIPRPPGCVEQQEINKFM